MIVITGAAGFIGSAMARFIQRVNVEGERVLLIDNLTYAADFRNIENLLSDPNFEFLETNITEGSSIRKRIESGARFINFAAESHVDRSISSALPFLNTNVLGAFQFLETFRACKGEVFVQVSTDEVYGSLLVGEAFEDFNLDPNSPYAASKASADLLLMAYARTHDLDLRITRCGNNFGPRQHPEKLLPTVITSVIKKRSIPIYGDGKNIRNWIQVEDHCDAIWAVLQKGKKREIYNVAGKTNLSNIEIVNLILEKMNYSNTNLKFVTDRLGHDFRYAINANKINLELEFSPKREFHLELSKTIEWYVGNQDWWQHKLPNRELN